MSDGICPVCGDTVDFYGCLGEMRGRHVSIELEQLRARVKELETKLQQRDKACRYSEGLAQAAEAKLAGAEKRVRELDGQITLSIAQESASFERACLAEAKLEKVRAWRAEHEEKIVGVANWETLDAILEEP